MYTPSASIRHPVELGAWCESGFMPTHRNKMNNEHHENNEQYNEQNHHERATTPLHENLEDSSDEDAPLLSQTPRILAPDWKRSMQVRLKYYVPILKWLPELQWSDVAKDCLAGVTCAMVMLPAALSYSATIVKVPPIYGMYTCIFPALVYCIFGTSKQLSVGPEAVVSLLTGSAISEFLASTSFVPDASSWEESPELLQDRVSTAAALALLVGLITLLLGIFRVGFLDNVLSRPLLRGFITAIACVIVVEQLGSMVFGKGYHWEYPEPPSPTTTFTSLTSLTSLTSTTSVYTKTFSTSLTESAKAASEATSYSTTYPISYSTTYLTSFSTTATDSSTTSLPTETPQPTPQPEPKEHPPEQTPLQKLILILHQVPKHAHLLTCLISLASIAFLVVFRVVKAVANKKPGWQWVENVPDILILMLISIIVSIFAKFESRGVRVLGKTTKGHGGLVAPSMPFVDIETARLLMLPASLIAVIGFVESNASAKAIAGKYDYAVSPNRELVALGACNVFGSVFGCWPAFGSLARTTVVDRAGGKSQVMGVVSALVVFLVAIWLLPLLAPLPIPVLASIISVAASGLVELEDVSYFYKLSAWKELSMMLLSFLVTFILGIELGTLVSILVSLIMVIRETTRVKVEVLGMVDESDATGTDGFRSSRRKFRSLSIRPTSSPGHSPVREEGVNPVPGILLLRIQESMLFFGNTAQLRERLRRLEVYGRKGVHPGEEVETIQEPTRAVVLDWSSVNVMDASALQILDEIVSSYHGRGILVCMVKVSPELQALFETAGLHRDVLQAGGFFDRIRDAIEFCQTLPVQEPAHAQDLPGHLVSRWPWTRENDLDV
jgi:MFS superfamily sulfate permease-like transporter